MAQIKQLSNAIEFTVKGTEEKVKVDFTDKRLVNKLLKLVRKYQNIEGSIKEKLSVVDEITDATINTIKGLGVDIKDKDEISEENYEKFIEEKVSEDKKEAVKRIIADGNIDIMIAVSDAEVEILTDFKKEVDDAFNAPITDIMFGNTLPPLEYYIELFEVITPYIQKAKANENKMIQSINEKYKINNIVDMPKRTEI